MAGLSKKKLFFNRTGYLLIILVGLVLISIWNTLYMHATAPTLTTGGKSATTMSYHANIVKEASENENFRRVLFTGPNSQLVVMSIPPGGEVGEETHNYTEQTIFFLSGTGKGMLNDKIFPIGPGDVVVVTAGTKHNFRNTGIQDLKIYTVYAPPNHIDGRIHDTKADADADVADETVGEKKP